MRTAYFFLRGFLDDRKHVKEGIVRFTIIFRTMESYILPFVSQMRRWVLLDHLHGGMISSK